MLKMLKADCFAAFSGLKRGTEPRYRTLGDCEMSKTQTSVAKVDEKCS